MSTDPPEPSARSAEFGVLRASRDDREAVVEQLRTAAAEERIDHDEFETRLERALAAKTHAELASLTVDLPAPGSVPSQPTMVVKGGAFGASKGPGLWEVPGHVIARGGTGGVKLDFTRVDCRLPEVAVEAYGETSGVVIVIPDGWATDASGMDPGFGGLKDETTPDRLPETPLIRLSGSGGLGGVTVRHPNRAERRKLSINPMPASVPPEAG